MTPTSSSSFSGADFAFTFQNPCTHTLENDKAEEGPEAWADIKEDKAQQKETPNTPENLKFLVRRLQKPEDGRKVQDLDHAKHCVKCNETFETLEERTIHIKTSPMHYCCQECEGIVEFGGLYGLYLHYKDHYPLLHCDRCYYSFATVEELKTHIKTSPRHDCCQRCDDIVEFGDTHSLRSHYEACHSLWYCDLCDHYSKSADESSIHIKTSPVHFACQTCEGIVEL